MIFCFQENLRDRPCHFNSREMFQQLNAWIWGSRNPKYLRINLIRTTHDNVSENED